MNEEGTVKWFDEARGYGWIQRDKGSDIFVHGSGIVGAGRKNLNSRDRVRFNVVLGNRGLVAKNVVVAEGAGEA